MEEKDAQVIIALSFGQGRNKTPGKSNEALARVIANLDDKYNLPIVAQWEIADCISGRLSEPGDLVVREHREKGNYLDTYEVLVQAKIHCDKFGFAKAAIVAHPDHAPRCAAVAAKIGFDVLIADTTDIPYDPESIQDWTRSKQIFTEQYEPKAMEYYRQKGYL
jgi:hypothetical protein